nr:reverse transcriptase domain-containing protein [Tanacetum cinerariifolium]
MDDFKLSAYVINYPQAKFLQTQSKIMVMASIAGVALVLYVVSMKLVRIIELITTQCKESYVTDLNQIYNLLMMTIANNIKSTLPGIENQNAKDFLKLVEEKFCSTDKALARKLMAELTTIKFDGSKRVDKKLKPKAKNFKKKQHATASKVANGEKRKQHNKKCNFCKKEGHFQKDCPKRKAWFEKKEQFEEDPPKDPPEVQMTDNRTMAEMLRAPTEGYAEAIIVPPILAEQFELKHSLIHMITSEQFFGLEKDNPHDHIR